MPDENKRVLVPIRYRCETCEDGTLGEGEEMGPCPDCNGTGYTTHPPARLSVNGGDRFHYSPRANRPG